ncbi:uncharacterized protein UDID_17887 [Ustilago sp. UG-2017a]|nr:uncharacterized protein UDID_17887 [Ustilago sp. UG-2017a]
MDAIQSTACHRPHDRPRAADYGTVIRHLTFLCQQVEALATPLSAPGLPPHHSALPSALEAQGHRASTPSAARGGRGGGGGGGGPGSVVGFQAGFGGGGRAKRDLRRTGKDVIRIPKLVLAGGQSTGESSLVECLAGVTLPRSQGTCTRGPLDITITGTIPAEEGEGWSALVSIVLSTSKNDLPPACESCPGGIIRFGEPINDPALVADQLRRATLAVRDLRNLPTSFMPSPKPTDKYLIPASPYQHMSLAQLEDAEDDPDSPLPTFFPVGARLSLSIRAPGAEPLCFTDLPGLISEGSAFEINAIRNMILRDISESNTVIVLTASLAMDIRHQNAFSLVKSVDPNGERTVAVLTMPDRMPSGAERQWANMINESSPGGMNSNNNSTVSSGSNSKHFLKHGWHVVRCPAQHEDRSNIREIEDNLFFLCMDILAITDNYVQSELTSEMQRLSARVAVHPPATLPRAEISIKPSQSQSTTVTPTAKQTSPHTPRQSRSMFSTPDSTPTKPPPSQTQLRTSVSQSKRPPPSEADTPTRAAPRRTATLAAGGWQAVMDAQLHNEPCRVVNSLFTFPRSNFAEEDYDDAPSDYLHNQPSQSDCEGEIRKE